MSRPPSPRPAAASPGGGAIRCRGLVKRYGEVVAVAGLDLDIAPGECFGLLGPNGAGKTTTIEILEGLLEPDAGEVEILGRRWATDRASLRQRLGIHLQESQFDDRLSVRETLDLFRSFYPAGQPVDDVLALLGLEGKASSWVSRLSGGQRQRMAIGCALVGKPDVLFLDEPTTGLDPQARRQVWEIVDAFRGRGGTVLLTTHYMDEAEVLSDRVAIVDSGRIIACGPPRELVSSLGAGHVIGVAQAQAGHELGRGERAAGLRLPPRGASRRPVRPPGSGGVEPDRGVAARRDAGAAATRGGRRLEPELALDAHRHAGGRLRYPHRTTPARWLIRAGAGIPSSS